MIAHTFHHLQTSTSHSQKVKTTQPRRYLVRPNQGIVSPNSSESISILLVDKDRQVLWSTYDRLGQSALDHSKDKFLVQSCVVDDNFAKQFRDEKSVVGEGGQYRKELVEALTGMWNSVASGGTDVAVYNKKLHVKHVVDAGADATAATGGGEEAAPASSTHRSNNNQTSADKMSREQAIEEVSSLRRKYDELVAFSVNLTAERDILNNTLEQTRRDLNREVASRQALEKQGANSRSAGGGRGGVQETKSGGGISMNTLIMVGLLSFFVAVRATNSGAAEFLHSVPILGGLLGFYAGAAPRVENVGAREEL